MTSYSNKANALRAARKTNAAATVYEQDGRWYITEEAFEATAEELAAQTVRPQEYVVADAATMTYDEVHNALCPNCGIHLSNGLLTCDDEVANGTKTLYEAGKLNHEYECMGCGKGFGAERQPYVAPVAKPRSTKTVKHNGNVIDKVRETRNGQTKPSANTLGGKLWALFDEQHKATGAAPVRAWVLATATEHGFNTNMASCLLSHWRKFNGFAK